MKRTMVRNYINTVGESGRDPFMASIFGRTSSGRMSLGNYDGDDDEESDYDPDEDLRMIYDDEEYEEIHESY